MKNDHEERVDKIDHRLTVVESNQSWIRNLFYAFLAAIGFVFSQIDKVLSWFK